MLILSRKKDESLVIDGNIVVKIIDIGEGKVRIGIDAPKSVEIYRKEIFDIIKDENIRAGESKTKLSELAKAIKGKENKD